MAENNDKPGSEAIPWVNNPQIIKNMKEGLSDEQLDTFRIFGEKFYGSVDFETGLSSATEDAVAYIRKTLDSGLHPSCLDKDERYLLENKLGEEWYKEWGFTKKDLDDEIL